MITTTRCHVNKNTDTPCNFEEVKDHMSKDDWHRWFKVLGVEQKLDYSVTFRRHNTLLVHSIFVLSKTESKIYYKITAS